MILTVPFSVMASEETDAAVMAEVFQESEAAVSAVPAEQVPAAETGTTAEASKPAVSGDFSAGETSDVTVTPSQPSEGEAGESDSSENGGNITPVPGGEVTPAPGEDITPTPGGDVTPTPGEDITPTPGEEVTPTPGGEVTPTPGEDITPIPGEEVTPTPGEEVTPTPVPDDGNLLTEAAQEVTDGIQALAGVEITLEHESQIQTLRAKYDALTPEEKETISNYDLLVGFETRISELKAAEFDDKKDGELTDGTDTATITNVKIGTPVYYTNMVSNIHAGKEFYLSTLKNEYQITFSDDFAQVMETIEKEYKEKKKLSDVSDSRTDGVTSSADSLLVRNWQDIIAIYIYEKNKDGAGSYTLDASCKEELAVIFEELNPVVRDKKNITQVSYGNRHINYYIKKNKISKEDRKILKKYVETDCKLLCATVTAAKGFVRQSVGDDVSEERVNVISAAYSLIGKVGYFWGGKSTVFGDDPSWGTAERVTSPGSNSTGTVRAYGLDCSGFVTWAVVNGYHSQAMQAAVGDGTSDQWMKAQIVSEADAQPGDLVFQRGPEAGSDNHVGILCGKTDSGDWIAVHCSSSKNGVTVGEAYSASFRYIRQPSFYPSEAETVAAVEASTGFVSQNDDTTSNNSLQNIVKINQLSSGSEEKKNTLLDDVADVEVFVAK